MNYHLHRGGKDLGVHSLEEVQRRRATGELTGAEWVWGEGMSGWEPLDSFLQTAPAPPRAAIPPPLPSGVRGPSRTRVAILIACSVTLTLAGLGLGTALVIKFIKRGPSFAASADLKEAVELAGQPVETGPQTTTQARIESGYREFRRRQWIDGYQEHSPHDQAWDKDARQMLEVWQARAHGDDAFTNLPSVAVLGQRLVNDLGCEDPLVLTVAGLMEPQTQQKIRWLEKAIAGFPQSRHQAYPHLYATVMLAGQLTDSKRRRELDTSALRLLGEALKDGSIKPEDEPVIAEGFFDGWAESFLSRNRAAVYRVPRAEGAAFQWLALVLEGEFHVLEAWRMRGGGTADTVDQKGWLGFASHLVQARRCFTEAWNLRPERALAAVRMVYVAMGDSGVREMRQWFDRAVSAQIDQPEAWSNFRWGLRPRWHGNLDAMLALGRTALGTRRFDTDVPRKLFDVVSDMESELDLQPGEHIYDRPEIWPLLQGMYEGYLAEPSEKDSRPGWSSTYSVVAYLAGKQEMAKQLLEGLDWEPHAQSLGGWGRDLSLMPLEVAAYTGGVAAQIVKAEEARTNGDLPGALRLYKEAMASSRADHRTKTYARHQIAALELEMRLPEGGWVDWLPADADDPAWSVALGTVRRLPDGALEVDSGAEGHLVFARARVGAHFEMRGQIEVVQPEGGPFQAGVVFGRPEPSSASWYAYRIQTSAEDKAWAGFSRRWERYNHYNNLPKPGSTSTFLFRSMLGRVSGMANDQWMMFEQTPSWGMKLSEKDTEVGLGGPGSQPHTVFRYRNIQVRRLAVGSSAPAKP